MKFNSGEVDGKRFTKYAKRRTIYFWASASFVIIHENIHLDQGNGNQQLPGESETNGAQINKLCQNLVNSDFVMVKKQQMPSIEYTVSHFYPSKGSSDQSIAQKWQKSSLFPFPTRVVQRWTDRSSVFASLSSYISASHLDPWQGE